MVCHGCVTVGGTLLPERSKLFKSHWSNQWLTSNTQSSSSNDVQLSAVEYRFVALGDRVVFTVKPEGFSLSSVLSPNSPYVSSGLGAISRFASESPIFKIGSLDAGLGFDWLVTDRVRLQFAYGSRNSSTSYEGLFDGDHRALGVQFFTIPIDDLIAGITYVNAFSDDARLDTFTGSFNADTSGLLGQTIESAAIHAVNGTLQVRFGDFTLGAWGGFMFTDSLESDARALSTTYLGSLGWFDAFGREGDLWAVLVGQPPKLVFGTNIESTDEATSIHFETFYRFQLSDNLYITPGVFIVTDPGHIFDNDNIVVGTLRTTFRF